MDSAPSVVLTPRERDVVRGVIAGRTNREIARELDLGEQAVKNLLSTVYQKCHVRSRLELALFAVRHRLLKADGHGHGKKS
jgi:DNA-binding NarL/FixJ family response regulator